MAKTQTPDAKQEEQTAKSPLLIKVKDQYKDEVVGFNNSGKPLGQRDDLIVLAELALTVNPDLKKYFELLPELPQLENEKTRLFLANNK